MKVTQTSIAGLYEIEPRVFEDERGHFFESYSERVFSQYGLPTSFVQDNQSFSQAGVLRGLHFQRAPYAQGKLVRVLTGRALDVVVDLRAGSPTFGQHLQFELDAKRQNMVYVPVGFAHGFLALEDCRFFYKCTNLYNWESEGGLRWDDPTLKIEWPVSSPNVSPKDLELPFFDSQATYFE